MIGLLGLSSVQLAMAIAVLWHSAACHSSATWWGAAIATGVCAVVLLWQLPMAYRRWLWRRRKNPRASLEVCTERRRMAAALHDAVGSQLVCAMALAHAHPDPALLQTLEYCLLELRLIVDAIDDDTDVLPMCMARFRYRLQPVLQRRAITLHWQVENPEQAHGLWPQGAQAKLVMAVLQEAVSNVLQHAQAHELWITLKRTANSHGADYGGAQLCVQDNGVGLPPGPWQARDRGGCGAGLHNMHSRARAINGVLTVCPREGGGTCVELCWGGGPHSTGSCPA